MAGEGEPVVRIAEVLDQVEVGLALRAVPPDVARLPVAVVILRDTIRGTGN